MPSAASLANLRPAWQPGQSANARGVTRGYKRVLKASREASPRAIERAIECMDNPDAPWPARLKAVEIILDRAWGAPDQKLHLDGENGIATLRIEFVGPDSKNGHTTIDAETVEISFAPPDKAEP